MLGLAISDPHWINAESYTQQFHASISHAQRTSRSLLTSLDSSYHVLAELAAQYNAWSLSEPPLGQALERIGQALDATAKATTRLRTGLEASFVEPVQEQAQLADSVDKVLQWRHARNVEWESVLSEIEGKRSSLAGLERTEQEAVRVQQGLQQGNSTFSAPVQEAETAFPPPPTSFPPTAELGSSPPPRSSGILSTLNSLIDNDPAAARRATIARTREKIMTLSDRRENLQTELAQAGTAIQTDLDRYQREKMAELKGLVVAFAKEMREYSRRAAQAWEEAEKEVDKVEL